MSAGLCSVDQDFTSTAEELIRAVTRAFYSDNDVFLIDVLIRDKYLRDDTDMETRLKIDSKILRKRLNFLIEERLVSKERVDDLTDGGSASTTFYYIDYYLVVQIIAWRMHLMRTAIEKEYEDDKKSASSLVCPNCEGSFQPIDYANWMDMELGAIVCGDCKYENSFAVEPVPPTEYILRQAEQERSGGKAKAELDRLKRQTSRKCFPGGGQVVMRSGIMELLQKVRSSKIPLSSNRPSDNHARGRGSKRIEGTGKTAANKAKRDKEGGMLGGGLKGKTVRDSVLYAKDAEGKDTEIVFGTSGALMGEEEGIGGGFDAVLKNAQKRDQDDFRKEAKNLAREQKILGKKSGQTAEGLEHLNADDVREDEEDEEEARRRKRAKISGMEKTEDIKSRQEELLREKELKEERDRQYQLLLKQKKKELGLEDSDESSSEEEEESDDSGDSGDDDEAEEVAKEEVVGRDAMEVDDDDDDDSDDSDAVNWEDDG
ncbi:hypothetical protein TrST_g10174 [Triparma strigata]|uniref:HTH TFE/IIEalpha-type domain-containing protein n=1 Tax=Triparma strigata TaxID=1606541 RepID=A0A9W6ZNY0_9STRA|nr:hypothetical protein TrST_g10174 [Triparma strigata]